MPRPPIARYWIERVRAIVENDPRLGSPRITKRLEQEGAAIGRDDYPSERAVSRIKEKHRAAPLEERREYRLCRWPESMERGDLPWEASAAALELVCWLAPLEPLPIRLVKWYWRVTLAAGIATREERLAAASRLAAHEAARLTDPKVNRRVEAFLTYLPWRSQLASEAYRKTLPEAEWPELPALAFANAAFDETQWGRIEEWTVQKQDREEGGQS